MTSLGKGFVRAVNFCTEYTPLQIYNYIPPREASCTNHQHVHTIESHPPSIPIFSLTCTSPSSSPQQTLIAKPTRHLPSPENFPSAVPMPPTPNPFPSYKYLISKRLDPLFALVIGLSAAIVRIRREEREKGIPAAQSWESFKR